MHGFNDASDRRRGEKTFAQRLEELRRLREESGKSASTTEDTKEHKGKAKS